MTKQINKKQYEKPSMQVFQLNNQPQLLSSSPNSMPTGSEWPGGAIPF